MNSWAARSTSSPLTGPEKLTATAEAPALAMVPSQSSSSWEPSAYAFNLVQVPALPPDTEETAMLEEETFTTSTKASPALCGSTERVVTPEPAVVAKPPTAEIVADAALAGPEGTSTSTTALSSVTVTISGKKRARKSRAGNGAPYRWRGLPV